MANPRQRRPIVVGFELDAAAAAKIIRTSTTHTIAAVLLHRSPDAVRTLAWRLREAGYDCGPLRIGGAPKRDEVADA